MLFRRREDILSQQFDEQVLLFDLQTNLPYVLNGVASYIFIHTDGEMSPYEVAKKVCDEYHVGFSQALADIKRLYDDLLKKRIVEQVA